MTTSRIDHEAAEDPEGSRLYEAFALRWMGKNQLWSEALGREWLEELGVLLEHVRDFERGKVASGVRKRLLDVSDGPDGEGPVHLVRVERALAWLAEIAPVVEATPAPEGRLL